MNDTELLSDALFAEPDDFCLAAALVEHLECDRDMWRSEAERHVESIQQKGRYARDLVDAAALLHEKNLIRYHVLAAICSAADCVGLHPLYVFLVPGEQMPSVVRSQAVLSRRKRTVYNVTIGATRVLRIARTEDIWKVPPRLQATVLVP